MNVESLWIKKNRFREVFDLTIILFTVYLLSDEFIVQCSRLRTEKVLQTKITVITNRQDYVINSFYWTLFSKTYKKRITSDQKIFPFWKVFDLASGFLHYFFRRDHKMFRFWQILFWGFSLCFKCLEIFLIILLIYYLHTVNVLKFLKKWCNQERKQKTKYIILSF